jgi:hypothetical protein
MNGFVEEPLTPALGALTVAGILCDVRDHAGVENTLAMSGGSTTRVEIQI